MTKTTSFPLSARPGFLIRRLHQIHLSLFAEECAAFKVTPVQYSILTTVAAQPGLEQTALAQEVGIDRATLANVVARLAGRGLVAQACAADRRLQAPAKADGGAGSAGAQSHHRRLEAPRTLKLHQGVDPSGQRRQRPRPRPVPDQLDEKRHRMSHRGRIPDDHAYGRRIETVAGIVHLRTIGNDEDQIHIRGDVDMIAACGVSVDDREIA